MDDREKLVELLRNSPHLDIVKGYKGNDCTFEQGADWLINHGLTVQECGQWIYDFNLAGSNFYRCSVCDRQETLLEKEDIYEHCPFCHCGAKMMPHPPKGE